MKKQLLTAILIAGFVAGTLDAIAAIVVNQVNPIRMFQFIASGAIGRDAAFAGGNLTALYGVLFHFLIATSWAALFFLLYPRFTLMQKNKYAIGLIYGVIVWCVMNLVVIPMSAIQQRPFNITNAIIGTVVLMFMIGLPISILANRYYKGSR